MGDETPNLHEGGCTCGEVRYQLTGTPIYVHCCHCTWCQRESGSAFALNAMFETTQITVLKGSPEVVDTPTNSGNGQQFHRCPSCRIALWSHYMGATTALAFIRVGSLDDPVQLPPDIHIFTRSKQPWVKLPEGVHVREAYYDREVLWTDEQLKRRQDAIDSLQ